MLRTRPREQAGVNRPGLFVMTPIPNQITNRLWMTAHLTQTIAQTRLSIAKAEPVAPIEEFQSAVSAAASSEGFSGDVASAGGSSGGRAGTVISRIALLE